MCFPKFSWAPALSFSLTVGMGLLLAADRPIKHKHKKNVYGCDWEITVYPDGTAHPHGQLVWRGDTVDWHASGFQYKLVFDGTQTPFGTQNNFTNANDRKCSMPAIQASSMDDSDPYHYQVCIADKCSQNDPHVIVVGGGVLDSFLKTRR